MIRIYLYLRSPSRPTPVGRAPTNCSVGAYTFQLFPFCTILVLLFVPYLFVPQLFPPWVHTRCKQLSPFPSLAAKALQVILLVAVDPVIWRGSCSDHAHVAAARGRGADLPAKHQFCILMNRSAFATISSQEVAFWLHHMVLLP